MKGGEALPASWVYYGYLRRASLLDNTGEAPSNNRARCLRWDREISASEDSRPPSDSHNHLRSLRLPLRETSS